MNDNYAFRFSLACNIRYNFRRANFPKLYHEICTTDWSFLENGEDVNVVLAEFYSCFFNIMTASVPLNSIRPSKFPPWITREVQQNIKLKGYYRRKWVKFKNYRYYEEFKRLRSIVENQMDNSYKNYLEQVQSTIKSDPSS
ncbi:hypothetical protein Zmor_018374 [Zophobas morio]|uniref:RNA-directed DNA polymerase from mobile element jockey-like n=1 Tax=Zophobas morio TaxID=2755281 RepID=A0AA38IDR8_9CUCU|nr:hypothetical protein Zmor_018374 [Zophobas morio]